MQSRAPESPPKAPYWPVWGLFNFPFLLTSLSFFNFPESAPSCWLPEKYYHQPVTA